MPSRNALSDPRFQALRQRALLTTHLMPPEEPDLRDHQQTVYSLSTREIGRSEVQGRPSLCWNPVSTRNKNKQKRWNLKSQLVGRHRIGGPDCQEKIPRNSQVRDGVMREGQVENGKLRVRISRTARGTGQRQLQWMDPDACESGDNQGRTPAPCHTHLGKQRHRSQPSPLTGLAMKPFDTWFVSTSPWNIQMT